MAAGNVHGCQEVPGTGRPPYLARPDRAGGDLLHGQRLLQLRAPRGAVVAAAARPGSPATRDRGWVTRGHPCGCLLELREESGVPPAEPKEATSPKPRRHVPAQGVTRGEGRGAGRADGRRQPRPAASGSGSGIGRVWGHDPARPGGGAARGGPGPAPRRAAAWTLEAEPTGKESRQRKPVTRHDPSVGVFIANLGAC